MLFSAQMIIAIAPGSLGNHHLDNPRKKHGKQHADDAEQLAARQYGKDYDKRVQINTLRNDRRLYENNVNELNYDKKQDYLGHLRKGFSRNDEHDYRRNGAENRTHIGDDVRYPGEGARASGCRESDP